MTPGGNEEELQYGRGRIGLFLIRDLLCWGPRSCQERRGAQGIDLIREFKRGKKDSRGRRG